MKNPDPWHSFRANVLADKLKALAESVDFIHFQRRLVEVCNEFIGFSRGENIKFAMSQLSTPGDVHAQIHFDVVVENVEACRKPWGWTALLRAMQAPSGRVHKSREGKPRRAISRRAAERFIHIYYPVMQTQKGILFLTKKYVEKSRAADSRNQPWHLFADDELIKLLEDDLLPSDLGMDIVVAYQKMRQNWGSLGGEGRAKKLDDAREGKKITARLRDEKAAMSKAKRQQPQGLAHN